MWSRLNWWNNSCVCRWRNLLSEIFNLRLTLTHQLDFHYSDMNIFHSMFNQSNRISVTRVTSLRDHKLFLEVNSLRAGPVHTTYIHHRTAGTRAWSSPKQLTALRHQKTPHRLDGKKIKLVINSLIDHQHDQVFPDVVQGWEQPGAAHIGHLSQSRVAGPEDKAALRARGCRKSRSSMTSRNGIKCHHRPCRDF